jgi:predicted MFS family arabinose efflux permease
MQSRKVSWVLIILGAAVAVAGILMRRSPNPALHGKASIIGWVGIAIILIGRIFLGRKRSTALAPKKDS